MLVSGVAKAGVGADSVDRVMPGAPGGRLSTPGAAQPASQISPKNNVAAWR